MGALGGGGETTKGAGVVGGVADTLPAGPSAPVFPCSLAQEGKPEAPTRQAEGSLQAGQGQRAGSSHSLQDPSANGSAPSGVLNTTSQRPEPERPFIKHPLWAPCPHLSHGPIPLASTFESLSK